MNQCIKQAKEILPCPKLKIPNAFITCSKDGQSCNVNCHNGYDRTNQKPAFCDHGTWRNALGCTLMNCGFPKIENAVVCKSN